MVYIINYFTFVEYYKPICMETKKLSEKESLELIAQVIRNSKNNLESGRGNSFLIWGFATFASTLIVGIALYLSGDARWNWLWFLVPAIGYTAGHIRTRNKNKVITFMDNAVQKLWLVVGITAVIAPAVLAFKYPGLIPFVEILIVSLGLAITGLIIDFKPGFIGGAAGIVIAFCTLFAANLDILILFGAWSISSMIIPGIKLNHYIKTNHKLQHDRV